MKNIAVMYHYVRDNTNFKCFTTDEFRKQIEFLSKRYKIITLSELLQNKYPNEKTCAITFDDGIKDGITNALPILKEFNAKASFFVSTSTLEGKKLLATQKRHILLAAIGTEQFVKEFNEAADDYFKVVPDERLKGKYDDVLTSSLKYVLDNMDFTESEKILSKIFSMHFNEEEEFNKIFLSKKDIEKLKSEGMEIGTHGHKHHWLGRLYFPDQLKDMQQSVDAYKQIFGERPRFMSYPFGSFNFFTLRIAKKLGFEAGITTVEKPNFDLKKPLELNRYDCNGFFPRKDEKDCRYI